MTARWSVLTPPGAGALAVVQLRATDARTLDAALASLGIGGIASGSMGLRDLAGADRGVVARWSGTVAHLYPHAGPAVLRHLVDALAAAGLTPDPSPAFPEASTALEAAMLAALARAASPLAIDLLLAQPSRWAGGEAEDRASPWSAVLNRLIDPPLVVAVGPPNVGKSTLLNTLAGRTVAIVSDEPGTTRDHVGVTLDLAGLVVRYADTPGLGRPDAPAEEAAAAEIAAELAGRADLLLLCGDAAHESPPRPDAPHLVVALRSDLGLAPWPHDAAVSALGGRLEGLVALVRERLVPGEALADGRPWKFW